jgi:hypothetical protein
LAFQIFLIPSCKASVWKRNSFFRSFFFIKGFLDYRNTLQKPQIKSFIIA